MHKGTAVIAAKRFFARSIKRPPPPQNSEAIQPRDPWQEVKDPNGTNQTYWWNTETNAVTPLGSPKPVIADGANQPPPPQAPGMMQGGGGLGGAVMEGMAWGVGSSMAHRMMDGVMGPRQMDVVHRDETAGGDAGAPSEGESGGSGDGGGGGWFADEGSWFGDDDGGDGEW